MADKNNLKSNKPSTLVEKQVQSNTQEQTLEQLEKEAIAIEETAKELLEQESQNRPLNNNNNSVEASKNSEEKAMSENKNNSNENSSLNVKKDDLKSLKTKVNVLTTLLVALIAGATFGAYYLNEHRFDDIKELSAQLEAATIDVDKKAKRIDAICNDIKSKDERMDELFTQNSQIVANNNAIKIDANNLAKQVEMYHANTQAVSDRLKEYEDREPNDWLIAQSYFLVSNAQSILEQTDNVSAALLNLERADVLIAKIEEDEIIRLREALSKDIAQLKALPVLDTRGMTLKIDNIYNAIPSMPLNEFLKANRDKFESSVNQKTSDVNDWKENLLESVKDFSSRFIEVRRRDENIVNQFLSPDQTQILMKNIQTELLLAKVAIFNHDQEAFIHNLTQADEQLKSYFDVNSDIVAGSLESISELVKQTITYKSKGSLSSYDKFNIIATDRFHLYKVEKSSFEKRAPKKQLVQSKTQKAEKVVQTKETVVAKEGNQ